MAQNFNKCAPSKIYEDNSCFTLDTLKIIANKYNEQNKKNLINITDNKKELVEQLNNRFSNVCDNQMCWLKLDIIKKLNNEEINNNTFRTIGPSKKYDWLNTTNINDVISQYHDVYKDFIFLGAVPNDFESIPILGLSDVNFDDFIKNGKTKIGLVINLDTSHQAGSHWVALYTDLINNKLYFFDSVGKKPGKRIKEFNNKIVNYMYSKKYNKQLEIGDILNTIKKMNKNDTNLNKYNKIINNKLKGFDIRYNNIQHQQENSECGVYSINFILRIVKGESFDDIINNITTDEEVNVCRKVYFRNT